MEQRENKVRVNITLNKSLYEDYKTNAWAFKRKFGFEPILSEYINYQLRFFLAMAEHMIQNVDKSWTKEQVLEYFVNKWKK